MEKMDKKTARRLAKEQRREFLEENDYEEEDPATAARSCCGDAFQEFDAQTHDAWLLQCPKGMDPNQLARKKIKLPGRRYVGDLQVRATNYSAPLKEAVGFVTSKGKYSLKNLDITGYVVVSHRLNAEQPADDEVDASSEFPAPKPPPQFKLPVRHPFFGRDYKQRIEVPEEINETLTKANKKSLETSIRLRRTANFYKIRSQLDSSVLEDKERDVRQSVVTGVMPTFMKPLAIPTHFMDLTGEPDIKEESDEPATPTPKRKKTKTNGYERQEDVEVEVTSSTKKQKKRKTNGEVLTNGNASLVEEITIQDADEVISSSKKQRKRKVNGDVSINGVAGEVVTIKEAVDSTPQKRKKLKAGA